jgi:hypothetical protein
MAHAWGEVTLCALEVDSWQRFYDREGEGKPEGGHADGTQWRCDEAQAPNDDGGIGALQAVAQRQLLAGCQALGRQSASNLVPKGSSKMLSDCQ